MNMEAMRVREGDDLPDLYLRIYDRESCTFVDLSEATTVITAKFRERGSTTVLQTITCTKVSSGDDGLVKMTWPTAALDDLDAGMYEIEISVAFNGREQTANKCEWVNDSNRYGSIIPVRVMEDF